MDGIIQGGWGFVAAVYLITWTTLGLYTLSLYMRSSP